MSCTVQENPQKLTLPWWKSWQFSLAIWAIVCLGLSTKMDSTSPKSITEFILFTLFLTLVIAFIWFLGTWDARDAIRKRNARLAKIKADEEAKQLAEEKRLTKIKEDVELFHTLTGTQLNPAAIYQAYGCAVYQILYTALGHADIEQVLSWKKDEDTVASLGLADVWLVQFKYSILSTNSTEIVHYDYGLSWKNEHRAYWRICDNSYLIDEDKFKIPINIKTDEDITQILQFISKYHSCKEAAEEYTALYAIPIIAKRVGGNSKEMRNARCMMQEGPKMFTLGLNPDPGTLPDRPR